MYVLNYTITTSMTSNASSQVIQNNYTCVYAVEGREETRTLFTSACQKRSEQIIKEEGESPEPQFFDLSNVYYDILKTGKAP